MPNYRIPYNNERDGQIEFFDNYGIPYDNDSSILIDNTDGVYNGNIFEFKLSISNLNKVLFQAIKYLSKMRIKGESVPATIILIDLNATTAYVYRSKDYFDDIHKVYIGASSINNEGFAAGNYLHKLNYSDMVQSDKLKTLLTGRKRYPDEMYMSINIDENCIVGWAKRYYHDLPDAKKGDFIGDDNGTAVRVKGEIRDPRHFKGLINPYIGETNEKFKYLMDCLNDNLSKKDLGAFYTPIPYAKKAAELVQMAVARVPEGNDYIILDRCAGTGNLEDALTGFKDKNGDELLEHCVLSTYEYYEYKVLVERLGHKVKHVIPPTEADVVYENGKVSNADALSKDFIENPIIKQYVDDPKCTIILYENPPYRDQSQKNNKQETKKNAHTDKSYVRKLMSSTKKYGLAVNDILNLFVWSGWKYYMRNETDSYIIFAPIKHWKRVGISNKKFIDGYIFNRSHFHASQEAISCLYLTNIDAEEENITLHAVNLDSNENYLYEKEVVISKSHAPMSRLFDKRKFLNDNYNNAICCNRDGTEAFRKYTFKPYFNDNIIGYLRAESYGFDANSVCLVRNGLYNGHGFYLRKDNYLCGLPLFVAKQYPFDKWYYKNMVDTTSDGGIEYIQDRDFLKSCLIYTCLSGQNKCLSFTGSDGRFYRNELCFDTTSGETVASLDLSKMELNDDEKELIAMWNKIIGEAKKTSKYNENITYGIYQITKELNTFIVLTAGKYKKHIYDYPELNGNLNTLKTLLKKYFKNHIAKKMFAYQLIK